MSERTRADYRDQLLDIQVPPAETTPWGIRTLNTADFRQLTAQTPTGYYHYTGNCDYFEWISPHAGGAVVMRRHHPPEYGLSRLPSPMSVPDVLGTHYTVGDVPTAYGAISSSLARNLGFQVLTHTDLITAVQIPGINDYEAAFWAVNGQSPGITLDPRHAGTIEGWPFLDLVNRGLWPYDIHFFEAHAPAFVIGGPEYVAALRGMARKAHAGSPRGEIDWLGGKVDAFADVQYQTNDARGRVTHYDETRDASRLLDDWNPLNLDYPDVAAAKRRFNSVMARSLGISLPESEQPDIVVPF